MAEQRKGPGNPLGALLLLPIAAGADLVLNNGQYIGRAIELYGAIQHDGGLAAMASAGGSSIAQYAAMVVIGIVGTALARDYNAQHGGKVNQATTKTHEATPTGVGYRQRRRSRTATDMRKLREV